MGVQNPSTGVKTKDIGWQTATLSRSISRNSLPMPAGVENHEKNYLYCEPVGFSTLQACSTNAQQDLCFMQATTFTHNATHKDVYQRGVAMQLHSNATGIYGEAEPGNSAVAMTNSDNPAIDPMILARLDTGLLKCLRKLGTPKQRICSALCLSYAEYDGIVELLRATR
jgi:hypothetical protein